MLVKKPAAIPGTTILLGIILCSISVKVEIIRIETKIRALNKSYVNPNLLNKKRNNMPVITSTIG